MDVGKIKGHHLIVGESQGFIGLPIRIGFEQFTINRPMGISFVEEQVTARIMQSIWVPSPQDIYMLQNGAPILLTVLGQELHPPVRMEVKLEEKVV